MKNIVASFSKNLVNYSFQIAILYWRREVFVSLISEDNLYRITPLTLPPWFKIYAIVSHTLMCMCCLFTCLISNILLSRAQMYEVHEGSKNQWLHMLLLTCVGRKLYRVYHILMLHYTCRLEIKLYLSIDLLSITIFQRVFALRLFSGIRKNKIKQKEIIRYCHQEPTHKIWKPYLK